MKRVEREQKGVEKKTKAECWLGTLFLDYRRTTPL